MKQLALIAGLIVFAFGAIVLFPHSTVIGGSIAALGVVIALASSLIPAAPTNETTGLDAKLPGENASLNDAIIIEPNSPNMIAQTMSPTQREVPEEAPSGPPHPPESY